MMTINIGLLQQENLRLSVLSRIYSQAFGNISLTISINVRKSFIIIIIELWNCNYTTIIQGLSSCNENYIFIINEIANSNRWR